MTRWPRARWSSTIFAGCPLRHLAMDRVGQASWPAQRTSRQDQGRIAPQDSHHVRLWYGPRADPDGPQHRRRQRAANLICNQRQATTEKLETAICDTINAYNQFQLPRYWGDTKHAAADGTQWNLYENNLLSERHIRYGGYGGVAYYHVSDAYIALFSHFIPVWCLGGHLYSGWFDRKRIGHSTQHLAWRHAGAKCPSLRVGFFARHQANATDTELERLEVVSANAAGGVPAHQSLFSNEAVDWDLIACHLPDMLQVAQSIRAGRISPSTILRKLGTASRKNKLYFAFRELGRVIRTTFLLEYIGDEDLRRMIHAAQNKCEGFNQFAQWVHFGPTPSQKTFATIN